MDFQFEVTIKRMVNGKAIGTRVLFDEKTDLEEVFTPKIIAMILKQYAVKLEEEK